MTNCAAFVYVKFSEDWSKDSFASFSASAFTATILETFGTTFVKATSVTNAHY